MTDRSELAERLEQARGVCYYTKAMSGIYLDPSERDLIIAALRAPALPSEEEIRRKILDAIESSPVGGLNAEGGWIEAVYWNRNGYINGLRAVLALLGKTGGEK